MRRFCVIAIIVLGAFVIAFLALRQWTEATCLTPGILFAGLMLHQLSDTDRLRCRLSDTQWAVHAAWRHASPWRH